MKDELREKEGEEIAEKLNIGCKYISHSRSIGGLVGNSNGFVLQCYAHNIK